VAPTRRGAARWVLGRLATLPSADRADRAVKADLWVTSIEPTVTRVNSASFALGIQDCRWYRLPTWSTRPADILWSPSGCAAPKRHFPPAGLSVISR
jgi:hypothetical protein